MKLPLWRRRRDEELEEEIQSHLRMAIRDRIERGESAEEAELAARREFGNVGLVKETTRGMWGFGALETLWQDLRYGVRMLKKAPGFTLVAALAIGLGVSANTTIFGSVDATLLHPFAFPNRERLVMVWEQKREIGVTRGTVAPGNFTDWRAQNQVLQEVAAMTARDFDFTSDGPPERYRGYSVSPQLFEMLGVQAALGRTFTRAEGEAGRERVVVLKHDFWQKRFGADPTIVGKSVLINGQNHKIIGVTPEHFDFPYYGGQLWLPLVFTPQDARDHGSHYLTAVGLLKPGVSVAQAHEDLLAIARRLQQQYPETNAGVTTFVNGLTADYTRRPRRYLRVLMGAVGFVLLIACANVANLMLARGAARNKEIALRLALGASRWRIAQQLLVESALLALMGGALGLLLAGWGLKALERGIPEAMSRYIPGWHQLGVNRDVLLFTLLVSVATVALFGLAPAWQATRTNLNESLKDSGKGAADKSGRHSTRHALVIAEISLSLVLLVGAGLMARSFIQILRADFGVKPDNAITLSMALPGDQYATPQKQREFFRPLLRRIAALPGVTHVGMTSNLPFTDSDNSGGFTIEGQAPFERGKEPYANLRAVTPDYFDAIGTALHAGRGFTEDDDERAPRVALINDAFAAKYFPGRSAIGQRLRVSGDTGAPLEIVGLTANVMNDDLDDPAEPYIYQPLTQHPGRVLGLVIRSQNDPSQLITAVRRETAALNPQLPLANVKALNQLIQEREAPRRVVTWMMTIFALMALSLATMGTYAVMAYAVAQRKREFGVRVALGARPADIVRLVVRRGLLLAGLGAVLGLGGAFALTRVLAQFLYGVTTTDWITFVSAALLLGVAALVACYLPARRASKVDPLVAIRCE